MPYIAPAFAQQQADKINQHGFSSLLDAFDTTVERFSERKVYSSFGHSITFAQLDTLSAHLAAWLQQQPYLNPGDRVAIQLPNITQYGVAAWAVWRAGMVLVNTNPMYTPSEMVHQFNDSGAKAIIALADLLSKIAAVVPQTGLELIVATHATDMIQSKPVDSDKLECDFVSWHSIFTADALALKPVETHMDDPATLQYTGGTTGVSKGAVLSHSNLYCAIAVARSAMEHQQKLRGDNPEVIISPMPIYHIYGFALSILSVPFYGGESVLIADPRNIDGLLDTMKQYPFTGFAGVNTLFSAMLQHPKFDEVDWSHLDTTLAGGAAMAVELAQQWHARTGTEITEGYGLTESCATTCVNRALDNEIGTVGQANKHVEVRLIDASGKVVEDGGEGELCIRGPHIMQGYWQREEATRESIDSEGWFRTGDVAVIHPRGHIQIVDRLKDMILVSGFNVYPNEIENVVYSYPGISEAAVIGVPSEATGEAVKLFVVSTNPATKEEHLIAHCREHLTAYKVPKIVEFRDELPKSNVGKILRRMLRDA